MTSVPERGWLRPNSPCLLRLLVSPSNVVGEKATVKKTLKAFLLALLVVGAAGVSQAMAQAVTSTYMYVPGINGSSSDLRHRDWIDVLSLTQTLDQSKKQPQCTMEVVKGLDISGPPLWGAAVTGRVFGEILIDVTINEMKSGPPQLFYQIKLQSARVRGIATIGNGRYVERITLDAASVQLLYYPQGANGSLGAPVTFAC